MARSKSAGIPSLDPKALPAGITLRKRETRESVKDDKGNIVKDKDGNTQWNRSLIEVLHIDDAAGLVAFQKHVTENGPEKYDGNQFLASLVNSHLGSFPIGAEIATAPEPNYVDPAEAVQRKIADAFAAGTPPDAKTLQAWYKEAGLM